MNNVDRHRAYWRANKILITVLLVIWALVSIGAGILAVDWLNRFQIGRLPLGFWMAQQGSIIVFVILIFAYAWIMDRLDHKYQLDRDEPEPPLNRGADI